jgi:nucleoid-associated protein YgaU
MPLAKAVLVPKDRAPIPVRFNPTQYGLDKANVLAEVGIPGLAAPIIQYVHGGPRTLTMDLFFDTYEEQADVRLHTDAIYSLLGIEAATHVPPICRFVWGDFIFRCVLERVNGRFTLFLANGTPVRATLTVSLKEYVDVNVLVRTPPTESADHAKTRVVARGETLSGIAAREYGDPAQWRPIAEANGIDNPRVVEAGRVLVVPPVKR